MEPGTVRSKLGALSNTVAAGAEALAVDSALADLFPDQGLRRGTVLGVSGAGGAISLVLAVMSRAVAEGSWAAVVGAPALGVEAAAGFGVRLDHVALIPNPGAHWTDVVGALLDVLDVVVVSPPRRCRPADARRLTARTRDRYGVLVVIETRAVGRAGRVERWPESVDLQLEAGASTWHGLEHGDGTLARRELTVRSFGRRSGGRERSTRLWLPAHDGSFGPMGERRTESSPAGGPAAGTLAG